MTRALSGYESPMVPKHLLEGQDPQSADLANNPAGTGAFKFVEWKKGQYIRFDNNENYGQDGLPYLDRMVARFIPDASTRTAAMENGEVHYGADGAIPALRRLRRDSRITALTAPLPMSTWCVCARWTRSASPPTAMR